MRRALQILRRALDGKVRVTRLGRSDPVRLQLERAPNPPTVVRLAPWGPEAADEGDELVIWVLDRDDRSAIPRLRRQDASYVDPRGGAVHLVLPWLLVDRSGIRVGREPTAQRPANPFSDRNSLVTRVLLADPGRSWGVRELAAAAGVTPGTVSKVVQRLKTYGLVHAHAGRSGEVRLADPRALLRRWTNAYDWTRNESLAFHAPIGDPQRFLKRLPRLMPDGLWALTLQAGASLVAPHAAWERIHLYLALETTGEFLRFAEGLGWQPSGDGQVVLMRPYYDESVWHGCRKVGGLPVVSDVQLVLDLWHYPLRGREQAEHLMETVLFAEREGE